MTGEPLMLSSASRTTNRKTILFVDTDVLSRLVNRPEIVIPYISDQLAMSRLPHATFALFLAILPATATIIAAVVLAQIPALQETSSAWPWSCSGSPYIYPKAA